MRVTFDHAVRLSFFSFIAFLCNTVIYADQSSRLQLQEQFTPVSTQIQQYIDKGALDGISIGVVDHSGLIWHAGFGFANREKNLIPDENTVYRVGSLSKLVTASAILQLEENEIIDIDQDVSAYIPNFYYKSRFSHSGVITARHLLSHLSGLPSNINKGQWTEDRFTDVVQRMHMEFTSYPTDYILNYSNVGYSLLGTLIEENTDYLFEDFIQNHLFNPLQMTNSNFHPYGATIPNSAIGYKNHIPQENLPIRDIPALGLNTSLKDLSNFISAILNHGQFNDQQILDQSSIESMFTVQNSDVELDYDDQIGLPWFINKGQLSQQTFTAEHGGTTINFSSQIIMAPKHDLAIIILSNTSRANSLINKIAKNLLSSLLQITETQVSLPKIQTPVKIENSDQGKKLYIAKSGLLELDKNGRALCDCQIDRKINLVPLPDGWFGLSPGNDIFPSKISEQKIDGKEVIVLEQNGKQHRLGSVYRKNENNFNWEQHFGKYDIINPDKDFPVLDVRVFEEEKITYICYRMPKLSKDLIVLPITPVSEKEAITEGLGRSKGETVYSRKIDGVDYLIYSGYIARKSQ